MKLRKSILCAVAGTLAAVPLAMAAGNATAAPAPAPAPKWAAVAVVAGQQGPGYAVFDRASQKEAEDAARGECEKLRPRPAIDLGSSQLSPCRTKIAFRSGECAAVVLMYKPDYKVINNKVQDTGVWVHTAAAHRDKAIAELLARTKDDGGPTTKRQTIFEGCQS